MFQEITLKHVRKPFKANPHEDITWFCDSLGFCSGRDLDNTSAKIVIDALQRFASNTHIPSEILARDLQMSTARVNHHIKNMSNAGMFFRDKRQICLRGGSVTAAVQEMRKDAMRFFDELEAIAGDIDTSVGLRFRQG